MMQLYLSRNSLFLVSFFLAYISTSLTIAQENLLESYQYISPVPDSKLNLAETEIIIREGSIINRHSIYGKDMIKVFGSKSGKHKGQINLSCDNRTIIYIPANKFELGEEVRVVISGKINTQEGNELVPVEFNFSIANHPPQEIRKKICERESHLIRFKTEDKSFIQYKNVFNQIDTLPDDFPNVTVSVYDNPAPGYIFLAPYNYPFYYNSYLLIIDNAGRPVFYQKSSSWNTDFTLQPNGRLSFWDQQADKFLVMDSTYSVAGSFNCKNGYSTDFHEFLMLENNHSILISYDIQTVRMDTIVQGGDSAASVIGLVIQELDSEQNLIFQWRSWDHIEIIDATEDIDLTAHTIDYIHGNAIEIDWDGNLLLSSRHLDEITKINRQTGEIIWRWGGRKSRKNEFIFINDPITFSHQHDIRRTNDGTYTIYDNGNLREPSFSRSLEYQLDENAKTATLIWSFSNDPKTYAPAMGSTLKLSNDNMFIGWGLHYNMRSVSEIKRDGSVALELIMPDTIYNYRAYKFQWKPRRFNLEPDSVVFDTVLVGDSAATIVTISNITTKDEVLTITDIANNNSLFTTRCELPVVLPPNSSEQIELVFRPAAVGKYIDTIHISSQNKTRMITQRFVVKGIADTLKNKVQVTYNYKLEQNYPNPFNASTTIKYSIAGPGIVTLKVYNSIGEFITTLVNKEQAIGNYEVTFDATELPSGAYFYRLQAVDSESSLPDGQTGSGQVFVETKKMLLLR